MTDVALFTAVIVPQNGLVIDPARALPVPWLTTMTFPTSPAGAVALTNDAPASVITFCPDAPVPPVPIFPSPCAPYAVTGNCHALCCSCASAPAVTTCTSVAPAAWAAVTEDSAPRCTVHVVPEMFWTVIISAGCTGSATWNWVAPISTAGNPADDVTVHVSTVPGAGVPAVDAPPWYPLAATVVEGLFANSSCGMYGTPQPISSQVSSLVVMLVSPVAVVTVQPTWMHCAL